MIRTLYKIRKNCLDTVRVKGCMSARLSDLQTDDVLAFLQAVFAFLPQSNLPTRVPVLLAFLLSFKVNL